MSFTEAKATVDRLTIACEQGGAVDSSAFAPKDTTIAIRKFLAQI